MDPVGGMQSVEAMRKAGNGEGKMYVVNHAGHHRKSHLILLTSPLLLISKTLLSFIFHHHPTVYLDNPEAVNSLLVKELDKEHKTYRHLHQPSSESSHSSRTSSESSGSKSFHEFYS